MLRKSMITMLAIAAAIAVAAPDAALARGGHGMGGGGWGGHGMGGGGWGGRGGWSGGGWAGRPAMVGGVRTAAIGGLAYHPGFNRPFHHVFPGRRFAIAGVAGAYGFYDGYYPYYDYAYDDSYYGDGGCYLVRQRVLTRYGWRIRPVQVCG